MLFRNLFGTSLNVHGVTQRAKYMGVFRSTTVALFVFTNELLDTRFDALLPGIRIAKSTNTAIQCGFTHVSTAFGLQFINSLKHRHSGMFWQARRSLSGQQRAVARMMVWSGVIDRRRPA